MFDILGDLAAFEAVLASGVWVKNVNLGLVVTLQAGRGAAGLEGSL